MKKNFGAGARCRPSNNKKKKKEKKKNVCWGKSSFVVASDGYRGITYTRTHVGIHLVPLGFVCADERAFRARAPCAPELEGDERPATVVKSILLNF